MKRYFLDASFVIAAGLKRDQNHEPAAAMWARLLQSGVQLVTTAFVFEEIVTFFNGKGEHGLAVHLGTGLLSSPHVEKYGIGWEVFNDAWAFFAQHQDKRYSFTDCLSFVVMKREGITEALTFDAHFTQAGMQIMS
jgi:predicted nucleic acid-binding protein